MNSIFLTLLVLIISYFLLRPLVYLSVLIVSLLELKTEHENPALIITVILLMVLLISVLCIVLGGL